MISAIFYLLGATALLIPADTSLDADLQVCLSCWQGVCSDDSNYNADLLCPCPCINSTLSSSIKKCGESDLVALPNPQCCSKANASFVSKFVSPFIEMIPPNLTNSNTCPGAYNEPANFVLSSYEEIASTKLNREYLYHDTPFTCSGCISSVTIYHKVGFNANVSIGIQLWRPSVNITDNTTNVLQAIGQEMNVTFRQGSSQGRDNGNYYITNSILSSSELCFKPGDAYGVYLPSEFSDFNILEEKDKDSPPNNQLYYIYYRDRPSCPSSGKYFFLNEKDAKPLIVVSVTSAAAPTPSSSVTDVFTSLLSSQSTISNTGPVPMTTSPSANTITSTSESTSIDSLPPTSSSSQSSSSSSSIITTTNTPTTGPFTDNIAFIGAGVIIVVLITLAIFLIVICVLIRINRQKDKSNKKRSNTLHSDSLDFQRARTLQQHQAATFTHETPFMHNPSVSNGHPGRVLDFLNHDYAIPNELNLHGNRSLFRSREAVSAVSAVVPPNRQFYKDDRDYMTMVSNVPSRNTTPCSIASDHYSHPRSASVTRQPTPCNNQRYDSPRSVANSSVSEYDDPSRVLDRTPHFPHKFMKSGTNPRRSQGGTGVHNYHVLENPNKATGQAEHPPRYYHELLPSGTIPKNNDYHVLEQPGSGYHVPTTNQRESMLLQGELQNQHVQEFFLNKPEYAEPPEQTEHIYEQLNQFKCREIPLENITMDKELGKGQFGTVYAGTWHLTGGLKKSVAIKRLNVQASEEEKSKFLREGARMMQFFHPNVVKLLGLVTVHNPPLLIQEVMSKGDLKSYLKGSRPQHNKSDQMPIRDIPSVTQLLKFGRDIASGMRHLAAKKFVHRDLAARNVLLNDSLICKIGDFGMTRAANHVYDLQRTEQVPLRWTAPEAFKLKVYSERSDVYSYGMVLYEIWSLGKKPFPRLFQNQEIIDFVGQRGLLPPPPGCPRGIYHLMVTCWNPDPNARLTFDAIYTDYLDTANESLVTWDKDDLDGLSSEASVIGAPLEAGYDLYTDLQREYRD